ncbi:MAG: MATE family efflux transporter [Lachnospiraceae bacterium]|nr:MATE family efflux transporter [Lachnospiraceae bacterium]MCI9469868.1 MATE family efflux transporter [Lachnospiraceae bacterium]
METAHKNQIIEGVIWKQLLIFFFPIVLGTFFQQLYNTVDTVIVGRFVGKEALASVGGSAGQLVNLVVGFFTGLTSGAAVVVSQFWGAKDRKNIEKSIHTAYAFSIAAGLLITVLGMLLTPVFLRWMNTPEGLMPGSILYLRIYYGGILFTFIFNTGSSILRATGDSRRPLYYLIVCCILNIVLDILFVLLCGLGIAGVSIATVLSQAVSACLVTRALTRADKESGLRLRLQDLHFARGILRSQLYIGVPTGLQSTMYSISNIIIQATLNRFGTDTVAAWAAFWKLDAIYWMISSAFGIAVTTFVGQNYGALKYQRIKKSVWVCAGMQVVSSLVLSVVMVVFRAPLLGIFTTDRQVLEIGFMMILILTPFYAVFTPVEVLSGALRGIGDVMIPTVITICGVCVLRIIWVMTAVPVRHEVSTIMVGYPVTWLLSGIAFIVYYACRMRGFGKNR